MVLEAVADENRVNQALPVAAYIGATGRIVNLNFGPVYFSDTRNISASPASEKAPKSSVAGAPSTFT